MKNKKRLKGALNEVLKHKHEMDLSLLSTFKMFGIKEQDISKKNLQKILLLSVQERAGPKLNSKQFREIYRRFNKINFRKIRSSTDPQKTVDNLYGELIKIPKIGTKIALVFMRDLVCRCKIFPECKKYLYQPVDVHIENIFIKKLKVFEPNEVPGPSEALFTKKNKKFQIILKEVHSPRIDFDYFWYVGNRFCNKRFACHLCWIRKYCQDPYFNKKNLDFR